MSSSNHIVSPRPIYVGWPKGLGSSSDSFRATSLSGDADSSSEAGSAYLSETQTPNFSPALRPALVSLSARTTPVLGSAPLGNLSARLTAAEMEKLFRNGAFALDPKEASSSASFSALLTKGISVASESGDGIGSVCSAAQAALQGQVDAPSAEGVIDTLYNKYPRLGILERDMSRDEDPAVLHVRKGVDVLTQLQEWNSRKDSRSASQGNSVPVIKPPVDDKGILRAARPVVHIPLGLKGAELDLLVNAWTQGVDFPQDTSDVKALLQGASTVADVEIAIEKRNWTAP